MSPAPPLISAERPLVLPGIGFVPAGEASDSDRQFTPPWVLELVAALWPGGIDVDPCHDPDSFVTANLTYDGKTPEQDGLAQSLTVGWWNRWKPQRGRAHLWKRHREEMLAAGRPCRASAVAFFERRISFFKDGVERKGNDREQMLVYWGARIIEFVKIFGRCAWVP